MTTPHPAFWQGVGREQLPGWDEQLPALCSMLSGLVLNKAASAQIKEKPFLRDVAESKRIGLEDKELRV